MNRAAIECEAKFVVPGADALRRALPLIRRHVARVGPITEHRLRDVYLDTEDRWLLRAGAGLRARQMGSQVLLTLKTLRNDDDALVRRVEWEESFAAKAVRWPGRLPDGGIRQWLQEVIGTAVVHPLVELDHRRSECDVEDARGASFKVCLDRVRIIGAPAHTAFQEVEIELQHGDPERLRKLVRRIERDSGWALSSVSKLERALGAAGIAIPAEPPAPEPARAEEAAGAAAWRLLRAEIERFAWHEPGARAGLDPESIHAMRVSARRIRAILRVFRSTLPRPFVDDARRRLKHMFQQLGKVRDLDIAIAMLRDRAQSGAAPEFAEWVSRLQPLREQAWKRLIRLIKHPSYRGWMRALRARLAKPPPAAMPEEASAPVAELAGPMILRRYKQAARAAAELEADAPESEVHDLRIRVKKLRYTIELFRELQPEISRKLLKRLRRLQEDLGAFQDTAMLRELISGLRTKLRAAPPADTVLAWIEREIQARREDILRHCEALTSDKMRRWIRSWR